MPSDGTHPRPEGQGLSAQVGRPVEAGSSPSPSLSSFVLRILLYSALSYWARQARQGNLPRSHSRLAIQPGEVSILHCNTLDRNAVAIGCHQFPAPCMFWRAHRPGNGISVGRPGSSSCQKASWRVTSVALVVWLSLLGSASRYGNTATVQRAWALSRPALLGGGGFPLFLRALPGCMC